MPGTRVKSSKTTLAGWVVMVGAVALIVGKLMGEGGVDMSSIQDLLEIAGLGGLGLGGLLKGIFSRDDDVSSEGYRAPKS